MPDVPELPSTPEELVTAAKRLRFEASVLAARAGAMINQAEAYEHLAALKDDGAPIRLRDVTISGKVTNNMVTTHRLAISKGRTGTDPFSAALREHKFTMRSLARRLGIPHSLISMYRTKDGRPCPRDRAEKIEKLTGWPADAAHWPNGLTS